MTHIFCRTIFVVLTCTAFSSSSAVPSIAATASASFQLLPGTRSAWAVSADGNTVIGITGLGASFNNYRWTKSGDFQLLGTRPALRDLSADGDIVVGVSGGLGYRWSATAGTLPAPGRVIEVRGTSTWGDVLVGSVASQSRREAYQWSQASDLVLIGDLPGGSFFSIAEAVSGDGSAVVGQSSSAYGSEPYLWTASEGIRSLGEIAGGPFPGWAFDISDDGYVVVGQNSESGSQAFAWTRSGGRTDLGDVPGGEFYSFAHGVSGNGSIVVGVGEDDAGPTAIIWDRWHGMRRLEDVLRGYGVEPGVRLYEAWDISSDGRTIIGTAGQPGSFQAFVAVLPVIVPEPTGLRLALSALCLLALPSGTIARPIN